MFAFALQPFSRNHLGLPYNYRAHLKKKEMVGRENEEGVLIQRCRRDNKRKKNELEVCGKRGLRLAVISTSFKSPGSDQFPFFPFPLRIGVIVFTWKGKCISFVGAFNFVLQSRLL